MKSDRKHKTKFCDTKDRTEIQDSQRKLRDTRMHLAKFGGAIQDKQRKLGNTRKYVAKFAGTMQDHQRKLTVFASIQQSFVIQKSEEKYETAKES